jgi:Fe-S oxidoreductase
MLAATKAVGRLGGSAVRSGRKPTAEPPNRPTALLFRGCVQQGLFSHVHDATVRTLGVNGYETREVTGQGCCGALHAHAGLLDEARALARINIAAFGEAADPIVVNSAGCGALMKEYGHLVGGAESERFAARVRDVTELLAPAPVPGAPLDLHVAYDPPCHLLHAQGIAVPPLRLFAAIPLLELVQVPGAAECCGSAGLFTLVEPEMSRAVLAPKLERLREAAPQVVATGNPGCLMQLSRARRRGTATAVRIPWSCSTTPIAPRATWNDGPGPSPSDRHQTASGWAHRLRAYPEMPPAILLRARRVHQPSLWLHWTPQIAVGWRIFSARRGSTSGSPICGITVKARANRVAEPGRSRIGF